MKNNKILRNILLNIVIMYILGLGYSSILAKVLLFICIICNIIYIKRLGLNDIYLPFILFSSIIVIFSLLVLNESSAGSIISNISKLLYYLSLFYLYFRISKISNNNTMMYIQYIILGISIISILAYIIYRSPIPININGIQYTILFKANFFGKDALTGPFLQPNEFGDLQVFLIIISIYNINKDKKISIFSIIVAFICIIMSISRTALLLASLIIMVYYLTNISKAKRLKIITLLLLPILLIILLNLNNSGMFTNLMGTKFNQKSLFSGRENLWKVSIQLIDEYTWIGVPNHKIRSLYDSILDESLHGLGAHNLYLHIMVNTGIIGFMCIINMIFFILIRIKYKKMDKKDTFLFISLFICVFIRGITESGLVFIFSVRIMIVWLLFGIVVGKNYLVFK